MNRKNVESTGRQTEQPSKLYPIASRVKPTFYTQNPRLRNRNEMHLSWLRPDENASAKSQIQIKQQQQNEKERRKADGGVGIPRKLGFLFEQENRVSTVIPMSHTRLVLDEIPESLLPPLSQDAPSRGPTPAVRLRGAIFIRLIKSANGRRNIVSWRPLERCPAGRRY